ncbi:MAG: SIMPL domain-containing protein [bacterium]
MLNLNCKSYGGVIAAVILTLAAVWVGFDIADRVRVQSNTNTIVVSGHGEIFIKPDLAKTSFSVLTEAKTAAAALSENAQKMNAVIDFAKGQGIEAKDLKTTNFSIYPRYEWQDKGSKRILVGYEVNQSLQVKIRDLTKVGAIIEGATKAGANQVGDLQFTIDQEDEFKKQAREAAIKEAKDKAKELASQLGVKLARIINFSESGNGPIFYGLERMALPAAGGGEPQIETGENKIEVQVVITYEIK